MTIVSEYCKHMELTIRKFCHCLLFLIFITTHIIRAGSNYTKLYQLQLHLIFYFNYNYSHNFPNQLQLHCLNFNYSYIMWNQIYSAFVNYVFLHPGFCFWHSHPSHCVIGLLQVHKSHCHSPLHLQPLLYQLS